ncbi:MAG: hypothetical protein ACKOUT_03790 [Novosphingobium sp.]
MATNVSRDQSTGSTPNAADFPAVFNGHPTQVGYVSHTTVGSGDNHMFRDTIPVVCPARTHLVSLGFSFTITKITDGEGAGDNDHMAFWFNGVKKYEMNVGAAAKAGQIVSYSLDAANMPPVGTGPNTLTATYSAYPQPISLLADISANQRVSFSVQDDTNVNAASVNFSCEQDAPPAPTGAIPTCCPPIFGQKMDNMFRVHQLPGKGLGDTYGLAFNPPAALDTQMKAFAIYAGMFAPNGWTANSVLLNAEMKKLNIPSNSTPGIGDFPPGATVSSGTLRGWWTTTPSNVWNGSSGTPFDQMFNDGKTVSPNHMQPNTWYMVKLDLNLASKDSNPNSWHITPINCRSGSRYVAINIRTMGAKVGPGANMASMAQIIEVR